MTPPLSVQEVLQRRDELAGQDVRVRGWLVFEFENVSLSGAPPPAVPGGELCALWLAVGAGSLGFNVPACRALHGRAVIVEGQLRTPDPRRGGCGHLSLWPAELLARTLHRDPAG